MIEKIKIANINRQDWLERESHTNKMMFSNKGRF